MIRVENLCRNFGDIKAVSNVSFTVQRGEILGFIGPNGAGKSTTMRMITGYLTPSSGTVEIEGRSLIDNESLCKKMIGYLPESAPMYLDMTVKAFLNFCGDIRGMKSKERKEAVDNVIKNCFLEKVKHQTIGTLSKGYRQRTCFAQSILHDPPILILDEPTDGLDPNQKYEIRKVIRNFGKNKVIILSTHILEEVESLCTRVVLISQGEIKADESLREFKKRDDSLSATFRLLSLGETLADEDVSENEASGNSVEEPAEDPPQEDQTEKDQAGEEQIVLDDDVVKADIAKEEEKKKNSEEAGE